MQQTAVGAGFKGNTAQCNKPQLVQAVKGIQHNAASRSWCSL